MKDDDFEERLAKLESQVPREVTAGDEVRVWLDNLLFYAVAQYLGKPTEIDSPSSAFARAAGYANNYEFLQAARNYGPEFRKRTASVRTKILAEFGVSWEHERSAVVDGLERMEAGLSEDYKRRLEGCIEDGLRRLRSGYYDKPSDSA